jgi:hypothetical protein
MEVLFIARPIERVCWVVWAGEVNQLQTWVKQFRVSGGRRRLVVMRLGFGIYYVHGKRLCREWIKYKINLDF